MGLSRPQKPTNGVSTRWVSIFCIASFFLGVLVVNRFWTIPDPAKVDEEASSVNEYQSKLSHPVLNCEKKETSVQAGDILSQVSQTHNVIMTLDKTISSLEMQLAAARAVKGDSEEGSPMGTKSGTDPLKERQKVFFVMGIITAFSSRKRRDSIRETWLPKGEELKKLETEKGIIIRFVIGHSASPGGVLDRAIDAEEEQHKDFLRLNHIEGYHELSSKTQIYFSTAVSRWDADFYIKVDDDVHINLGMIGSTLARHRSKPRVYIGCMKSGPVLSQKGVKYHEPEYWKFGEEGNKYFRHATGQIYAISKNLATYISVNRHILHRYANEDVSMGSWFIGLDVEHIDDRSLCCGTPPDCEWKAQAGNPCAASFDWTCSGICKSVERMEEVHQRCGEGDGAIWHTSF
ncbi:beta-1,6-galactosyltransferase GALT31A [Ricinus communis]|uniref:Hexosyltransferase n=1 Tax=Ricinus communis TaxID=3988 RepID=B9RYW6_RICCO|nr:beta-1,6-galactosyltransferase GALT31A [Ricinus communis]EEF43468.1 Beta-1,3-galactosyltransferase sqv-2, putative [Ricinus communis]|eukprot:XP_002518935.1 beta-1,6-galactosyltransferase GALT31A [Ricinus communis]